MVKLVICRQNPLTLAKSELVCFSISWRWTWPAQPLRWARLGDLTCYLLPIRHPFTQRVCQACIFLQHILRQTACCMTSRQRSKTGKCTSTQTPFYNHWNSVTQRWLSEVCYKWSVGSRSASIVTALLRPQLPKLIFSRQLFKKHGCQQYYCNTNNWNNYTFLHIII